VTSADVDSRSATDRPATDRPAAATAPRSAHDRRVVLVALGVMAVTTALAVIANTLTRQVSSDDLAWQRLLDIWGGQGHTRAWISEDLFPTRYPLYLVLDAFGIWGRRGVNVAAVTLDVAAGAAFLAGLVLSGELARPLRWRIVPALAVTSVWAALAWDQVFFSPNTRTLEFGLAVLLLAFLGRAAAASDPPRGRIAVIAALATLLWLSDPFVLYVVGGPAALVAVIDIVRRDRRRPGVVVLATVVGSGVAARLLRSALELFDVTLRPVAGGARHYTAVGDLPHRARVVFDHLAALFGVSGTDLTSGPVGATALAWLRLALIALGVAGAVLTIRRWSHASLLARTLVVCVVSTPIVVIVVNVYANTDAVIDRYLGATLVGIAGLAVVAVDHLRGNVGRVAAALMAVLVLGAFVGNVVTWSEDHDAQPDADALGLAHAVDGRLWGRVYGQYWLAVRVDQIARGGPRWIHVECHDGRLQLMPWHNDRAVLRGRPVTTAVALDGLGCTLPELERTYGPPSSTTEVAGTRFAVWEAADASPRLRTLR
jgi:hypothetical protein